MPPYVETLIGDNANRTALYASLLIVLVIVLLMVVTAIGSRRWSGIEQKLTNDNPDKVETAPRQQRGDAR